MLALFNMGGSELILVLGIALLLFGGKKLPELAKGLGQGLKEFKRATNNASEEMRQAIEEPVPAPVRSLASAPVSRVSPGPKA
jgi:sec-independent protein translocase protein TatA